MLCGGGIGRGSVLGSRFSVLGSRFSVLGGCAWRWGLSLAAIWGLFWDPPGLKNASEWESPQRRRGHREECLSAGLLECWIAGMGNWRWALGSRFSVLGSRFSVLGSRFSVLGSRFSVLGSRFSVLGSRWDRRWAVGAGRWERIGFRSWVSGLGGVKGSLGALRSLCEGRSFYGSPLRGGAKGNGFVGLLRSCEIVGCPVAGFVRRLLARSFPAMGTYLAGVSRSSEMVPLTGAGEPGKGAFTSFDSFFTTLPSVLSNHTMESMEAADSPPVSFTTA